MLGSSLARSLVTLGKNQRNRCSHRFRIPPVEPYARATDRRDRFGGEQSLWAKTAAAAAGWAEQRAAFLLYIVNK